MLNRPLLTRCLRAASFLVLLAVVTANVATAQDASALDWVKLTPANSPSPRAAAAMAYDPAGRTVVLFGGFNDTIYLNETWTFDGTTWTQQSGVAPPARAGAMMAYDLPTRKLVLFGGFNGSSYLRDTWLWDGATSSWTKANPQFSPPAVTGPMMFTDPVRGHADVFGGFDGRLYQLNTWIWTGSTWKKFQPATSPFARADGVVAVDIARKNVVISGGLGDLRTDNTWLWDGTDWAQQFPATALPRLFDTASAFDPEVGAVVVFGGNDSSGPQNITWGWSGTNWLRLAPLHSPPVRESLGMAYDFASKQLIIFGGQGANSLLNDTWVLVRH